MLLNIKPYIKVLKKNILKELHYWVNLEQAFSHQWMERQWRVGNEKPRVEWLLNALSVKWEIAFGPNPPHIVYLCYVFLNIGNY